MPWHSILLKRIPYLSCFLNTLWFRVRGNGLLDKFQCTKISFMYSSIARLQDELNSFFTYIQRNRLCMTQGGNYMFDV